MVTTKRSPFRSDALRNKVVLVTGGGSGIGYEITKQLLVHGCAGAVICGRREPFLRRSSHLLSTETGQPCSYQVCDVRQPPQCRDAVAYAVQHFGQLDLVVNCAAGNFLAQAKELSPKGFATVLAIDTLGTYNMSHAAFPALQARSQDTANTEGIIINISATLQCPATHWQTHASAAKAAVDSLTRSLALEWGPEQIRVVGIAPGPIANTPGTTKLAPSTTTTTTTTGTTSRRSSTRHTTDHDHEARIAQGIPLGRLGTATEIGHAAVFLATSHYTTGTTLIVDGGQWLYKPPLVPKHMVSQLSRKVEAQSRQQAPTTSRL